LTSVHFVGYVEGHDLFADQVEVVVADGFIGNIVLKSIESMGKAMVELLRRELTANAMRKMGAALAQGALKKIKRRIDPEAYGGAPLLGLNGIVIKAHGSARAKAILNAIRVATETIQHRINETIVREVTQANATLVTARAAVQPPANAVA
jgi:glycerol-3-phosphate acyltransferase PlsX